MTATAGSVSSISKGRRFALIVPSTNTSVEREFHHIRPQDSSWHTGRIMIKAAALDSADAFGLFREDLNAALPSALEIVMTANPDYIVMGMSAETFWGGVAGNAAFEQNVRELTGLDVTTGATAAAEALKAFGAKKIGIVTPYQPVGDEQVVAYFTELGFDVAGIHGLKSASATSIADETPEDIRAAFLAVDGPDVDALIQAGTNLEAITVAAELEKELGKPVIAINLATVWHALRANGINDKIAGHGSLLERF
ncbi:arylmalonate decarboxylase [Rhodococcus sp. AD45-ID]|uniref:maleate cis-trans isomerase family protein n=1 Tax=unclassified Rhodococcus (in: high G+C Gram-positive bacteria) TaxID=192944 RepID=UPI0005D42483|nr:MULTISPECIES: aspartate/glutamate racemase family protein [unclassified Rhodococcus (in: high G+C Gram-positive bacteria)]KJF23682.1 Arylmalonate decarboxylase [Rhodococcus sp. AD45]PSR42087.1 arylmalonate decarboxylase [Rhodococcus sp. AD45-ID]